MLPEWHVLFGVLLSALLLAGTNLSFQFILLFFVASFVIDIDHYFGYASAKKRYDPLRVYLELRKKFEERPFKIEFLCFLHTVEFLISLIALTFLFPSLHSFLLPVAFGFLFHVAIDVAVTIVNKKPLAGFSLITALRCLKKKEKA